MFVAQVIIVRWAGYSHLACVLQRMRSEVHVCRTASFYILSQIYFLILVLNSAAYMSFVWGSRLSDKHRYRVITKGLEQRQVLITNVHTFQIKDNTITYNRNHLQPKIRLDKWKRQVPPKRPYACTKLHGVIFQMTEILNKI